MYSVEIVTIFLKKDVKPVRKVKSTEASVFQILLILVIPSLPFNPHQVPAELHKFARIVSKALSLSITSVDFSVAG